MQWETGPPRSELAVNLHDEEMQGHKSHNEEHDTLAHVVFVPACDGHGMLNNKLLLSHGYCRRCSCS